MFAVGRVRRQVRDMFGGVNGNANSQRQTKTEPQQPKPKKKKIDANVGEYVEFEEVACTVNTTVQGNTTADCRHTHITVEQQVEDADWEEIPTQHENRK